MPVINGDVLLPDAITIDKLPPSRYALIFSLGAAARIHLHLDILENNAEQELEQVDSVDAAALVERVQEAARVVEEVERDKLAVTGGGGAGDDVESGDGAGAPRRTGSPVVFRTRQIPVAAATAAALSLNPYRRRTVTASAPRAL